MTTTIDIDPTIVGRIVGAIRTIRTHGIENDAVTSAVANVAAEINRLVESYRTALRIQLVDRVLIVNDRSIRHRDLRTEQIDALRGLFAERDLGGFAVDRPIDPATLLSWFAVLARPVNSEADIARLKADLVPLTAQGIRPLASKTIHDLENIEHIDVETFAFALQTFARAIVGFGELVENLRAGQGPFSGRINVIGVVQDLIGLVESRPDHLLRILARRREIDFEQPYAHVHAAATCVYALLMGRVLKLDRLELLDVGAAAILADVGFAVLPAELTEQSQTMSPSERAELKNFMIRAVQALFGRGRINDSMIRRIICAYEHHRPYRMPGSDEPADVHVYSRLVAVADAYDALTSERAWRPAMTPTNALMAIRQESGTRFDPHMVSALAVVARAT